MSVSDSLSDIERHFRERAQKRQWVSLLAAAYLRLGFPALLSLTILYKDALGEVFWPVVAVTSLVQGLSVLIRALTGKSEYAFFEYRDLKQNHDELQSQHENERARSRAAVYAIQALRHASQVVIDALTRTDTNRGENNLKALVREALFPVVGFRKEIFGFSGERYNFAVYRYNAEQDVLQVLYRDVHRDIPRQDREWKPGFGHVGFCFIRQEAVLSHDVTDSEELADDQSESDDEHYVSIAAAPISSLTADDDSDPRGVLIITSSESHQFEKATHRPFLIVLANILAVLFHVADH